MHKTTKIKLFKFVVSNSFIYPANENKEINGREKQQDELYTPSDIENIVNSFIKNKEEVSILVNHVSEECHNNGRKNTIVLYYTIIYKELSH